jgi:hypothetical protein
MMGIQVPRSEDQGLLGVLPPHVAHSLRITPLLNVAAQIDLGGDSEALHECVKR